MKTQLNSTFAFAGVSCALFGLALSGCNQGGGGNTGSSITGAPSGAATDTLATVGSAKITRENLTSFLETQGGEQALPILIDTQLVFEALKGKSLDVTEAEIDADLARRRKADPQVEALVAAGGPRLSLIRTQVKRELAIEKLLTDGIKPTEAQVKSFFEKNRRYYDQAAKVQVGILFASTKTRADLMAQQLKAKSKTFAQLVAEQKKVQDPIAGQSTESRPGLESLENFPPAVRGQLEKLPKDGITTPQSLQVGLPTPVFVIFRKVEGQAPQKADLTKIRAEVEADYKAAEVAKKTAAKNPENPPFDETLKRTYDSIKLGDPQTPPNPNVTLRDTLNSINRFAANDLLQNLRTGGTVQVEDAAYAKVAVPYQAAGAAGGVGNSASGNAASENAASENAASENAASGNSASENAAPAANAAP